jgi:GT2 family glycosyltransferase
MLPVSIVIPVYNGRELLEKLLDSIRRQTSPPLEVIVVDNGSSDGAPEAAARAGARVVAMGRNAGFAAAVNRGIREARGEGIALINSDVELAVDWLEQLWRAAEEYAADFATGAIFQAGADGVLDGSYDLICRGGCSWRAGAGQSAALLPSKTVPIRACSATAAIYRASLFRQVGYFEEAFESYLEDVDFGLRCAGAGRTGVFCPGAVCRHRGSATWGSWSPRVVRLIARNQVWLIARHYPWKLTGRWLWPILVAHFLWGGLALRHGCGMAWVTGKVQALWGFRRIRTFRSTCPELSSILIESEREIYRLQKQFGFDAYWRFYFYLVGAAR